ncbi:tripartite tricarboxylate transporter substrate binding protein [Falsiroseomonas sp.]|uniref:Bug family tripartite tricarboxylate transporter substrate binding protein n=1 Tax=Falsiroseomonas sp. TaxID=2870721 RepID=UPI0027242D80|nr:tripartite tricarboxylate transporter substrate binding protein [Falsiroseomonas sp.]MDO9500885.1 tripartite tricarboxylate transporter substrate binding protein [Falsiroseomonas sp.]MDP3418016.1 tripartite tricarboxylate transporter substrate binding protein [Falsiroseomonas sp.]
MHRRPLLAGLFAGLAAPATLRAQSAGWAPNRPLRLIIPYPPGGGTDTLARPWAEQMRTRLGQPVVIDNRGGAATNIGMELASRATPDGHTLVINADNIAYFPMLYRNLPYDLFRDFKPIAYLAETPLVVAINPNVPARNLREFVALAKESPEKFAFANPSLGSPHHLGFELLAREAGIRMIQAEYRGGGPAMNDVLAGHVHLGVFSLGSVTQHFAAGTLRPLAVLSTRRSAAAPDVPTTAEEGLPRVVNALRFLLLAPAATPPEAIAALHAATLASLEDPALRTQLTRAGFEITPTSPEEAATMLRAEHDRWAPILPSLNLNLG